ncbi:unnamed protein product, partial [Aureobasidium pullulans]
PRDPDFWKRFSYAVHQDEEAQIKIHLAPHNPPQKRHSYIRTCLTFWILLLAIITIFVVVIVILVKTGVLKKIHIGGEKGEQGEKASGDFGDWLSGVFGGGGKGDGDDGKSG